MVIIGKPCQNLGHDLAHANFAARIPKMVHLLLEKVPELKETIYDCLDKAPLMLISDSIV